MIVPVAVVAGDAAAAEPAAVVVAVFPTIVLFSMVADRPSSTGPARLGRVR